MAFLGAQLVEVGEPLARLPAASHGGMPLLACAVAGGSPRAVRIAAEWAARSGAAVAWREPGECNGPTVMDRARMHEIARHLEDAACLFERIS